MRYLSKLMRCLGACHGARTLTRHGAPVARQGSQKARHFVRLLDVALGLRGLAGVLAGDEHQALELGHQDAVLV